MSFESKTIIVTGASSGIGLATARAFKKKGADVLMVARSKARLEQIAREIGARFLAIDITERGATEKIVGEAVMASGKIDVLVNSAGIIQTGNIMNTPVEEFDYMMEINLRSVFLLMQTTLPFLKESKGNIVNVSSVTGVRAFPNILSYCVSKAGLDHLTRCSALELAEYGVRVNAVNPGVVVTSLHRAGGMENKQYEDFLEHSKTTHPLGRVGTPDEIAELIVFLASDKAMWITGETVSIDGGRFLTCFR